MASLDFRKVTCVLCARLSLFLMNITLISIAYTDHDFGVMTDSPLVLSTECPNNTISIYIYDDTFIESMESFTITLYFVGVPPSRVTLHPSSATFVIIDNDGRCCLQ